MIIKLLGDMAVFANRAGLTAESKGKFFVSWEVTNTVPLGAIGNLHKLEQVLGGREMLDDIVFFRVDPKTAKPITIALDHDGGGNSTVHDVAIDPSLSCYDQGLLDGVFLYATVDPWSLLGDEAYLDDGLADGKKPKPLPFTVLSSSSLNFHRYGDAVATLGRNRRRLVKYPQQFEGTTRPGAAEVSTGVNNSWQDSIGIANVCLNNEEVNMWGFRVYWDPELLTPHVAKAANAESVGSRGASRRDEEEGDDSSSSSSDDSSDSSNRGGGGGGADDNAAAGGGEVPLDDSLPKHQPPTEERVDAAHLRAGGEGPPKWETGTSGGQTNRSRMSLQNHSALTAAARRGNLGKLGLEQNAVANRTSEAAAAIANATATSTPRNGGSVAPSPNRRPSTAGAPPPMKLHSVPHVAVGVADVDIPLDGRKQHVEYISSFMLDVQSGAFYIGAAKRPIYANAVRYKPYSGMVLNFAVDTEEGVLNILQDGQTVLVASIPKMLADSLHPCAELFSEGAVVELV